jgi:hypothetical protein
VSTHLQLIIIIIIIIIIIDNKKLTAKTEDQRKSPSHAFCQLIYQTGTTPEQGYTDNGVTHLRSKRSYFAEHPGIIRRDLEPVARVPKMTSGKTSVPRGIHCCSSFLYLFYLASVSVLWIICAYAHTYLNPHKLCINYRCYLIILPVKHFYTNRERCEVLTGYLSVGCWAAGDWANAWHWAKRFELFYFKEICSSPSCFHIFFLIAFLEEPFIKNIIIILYINYINIQCFRKVAVHLGYGTYIWLTLSKVAVEVCCFCTVFSC